MNIDALGAALWKLAGILGAGVLVALLGYILVCLITAIAKEARKGGRRDG